MNYSRVMVTQPLPERRPTIMTFSPISDILADLRAGRMVVIVDDEDRENEGDLLMVAEKTRPEDINFMARYGRGLICLTLTKARCEQLRLPLMVSATADQHATNFTVSIEAAAGVTTGISAADRATTIRAAVAPGAQASDLVQPGHIFPLMAQPGGVLTRAGHTEAGCDLARLAGAEPAAVIVEILSDDGSMARRPELERFAAEHGLKMGTIADLIHYRLEHEKTIERLAEGQLATRHGELRVVSYRDVVSGDTHLAVVRGEPRPAQPTVVRVHMLDMLGDLLGAARDDAHWSLDGALAQIANADLGVIVLLRKPNADRELVERLRDIALAARGVHLPKPPAAAELRTYGVGAQILADLGVGKMRVLGTPMRLHGLAGFGLEVVEYVGAE